MASITVNDTMNAINRACKAKGGVYKEYSCKSVSWDDVKRGNVGGKLSSWGANITDTYLTARDGRRLFTVRSDNWNEKLGVIASSDLALVQGNQIPQEEQKPKQAGSNNFFSRLVHAAQRHKRRQQTTSKVEANHAQNLFGERQRIWFVRGAKNGKFKR